MTPAEVCDEVSASGLRGRGGGGFPTGPKWKFALEQPRDQKYLICNADEGDPGAFMDRAVIESDPFRLLEGMAIAAYAIGATKGYVYIRAEYPLAIEAWLKAHRPGRRPRACWARTSWAACFDFDIAHQDGRRGLRLRRRDGAS